MIRRYFAAAAVLVAVVLVPATAASAASPTGGWVRVPSPPFDRAAGVVCDFAVHGDPIVDDVVEKVLTTYPDGSPQRVAAKGPLVYRLTNTSNGRYYDADASGRATMDFHPDGSVTWKVVGPVLARIAAGTSNLPRGLYVIDGVYQVDISATRFVTVTMVVGTEDNVCSRIA